MPSHVAQPMPESVTREGYDLPGNMMRVGDYPLIGLCMTCGQWIRVLHFYALWEHIEVGPLPTSPTPSIPKGEPA